MATDLTDLIPFVDIELGGLVGQSKIINLLRAAVKMANAHIPTSFSFGGDDTMLNRDATELEQRLFVLLSVYIHLSSRTIEESGNAIKVSNPAGRTDLSGVEWALSKRRKDLWEHTKDGLDIGEIPELIARLNTAAVNAEIRATELGETLRATSIYRGPGIPIIIWP